MGTDKVPPETGFQSIPDCLPPQKELTVPNGQDVKVTLATYAFDGCAAIPTFTSDPKVDYASVFAAFLPKLGLAGIIKPTSVRQTIDVPAFYNGATTLTISCARSPELGTDLPVQLPRTVVLHYKNPPLFSGSAGVLISTLGKRTFGSAVVQSGQVNGIATIQNFVSITSSSKTQLIPFGFINTYVSGSERLHLDLQVGAGLNPNGSKNQVEYFFGPALTSHGIYISGGVHAGRAEYLRNRFSLGEAIPSGLTVPTASYTTYHFAIAISYSPPVKSALGK